MTPAIPAGSGDATTMDTAAEPGDLVWLLAEAWSRNDAAALAGLFAEDADFVTAVGLWWRNRRDIEKAPALLSASPGAAVAVEQVAERRLSEAHAVVHCRWRLVGDDAPGAGRAGATRSRRARPRRGILMLVAEHRPRGWVILAAQNTDVVPGVEPSRGEGAPLLPVSY